MYTAKTAQTQTKTGHAAKAATTLTLEEKINGVIIASFLATVGLIALSSFASLAGGLITSGGPLELAKGYFSALAGM